jgi:glutathione S-transferase/iron-sulfur cluster repair protein YtfE (RIC family)
VKLIGDVTCPYTQRIRIALLYKGVPVKATLVMPEDLKTCKGEDLASISPDGQFPVLHYGDHKLSGSTDAIVDYIEESFKDPTLVPNSLKKVVRYWVAYIRDSFTPVVEELLHDGDPFLQVALESRLNDALEHLDSGIKVQQQHGNYFLGSEFTLVDVYLIPFLARMDFVTYIRGIGLTSYPRLLAYKSAMCTFKYYKPVQVGMDLCKDSVVKSFIEKPPQPIIHFTILQHRSIIRHLENFVQLVKGLESTNKQSMDTKKRTVLWVQLKELPKAFGRLLQLMQEHAQMEERVIFPLLETADPELTASALKDHARDLPVMNGVREDIKGVVALRQGSADHIEALSSLLTRLESLQVHTVEHIQEEEKEQLPLLQLAGYGTKKQEPLVGQAMSVMETSHSSLLPYLLEGLRPHEVQQYLGIMIWSSDKEKISVVPKIARVLETDEFQDVWKVAVERFPTLAGPRFGG